MISNAYRSGYSDYSNINNFIHQAQLPPRYILGTSLVFWGVMSGMPLLGILLGLVVESAYWIEYRWDFSEEITSRTWQFNVLVIGLATVWIFLIETPYLALPILIGWLPVLLLPMQLIQLFGLKPSLPLSTFSFLAKKTPRTKSPSRTNRSNITN